MGTPRMLRVTACAWLAALLGAACGGSSSETPPPLEPDLDRLPPATRSADSLPTDEGASPAQPEIEDLDDDGPPPPDTWGSGRKRGATPRR